MKIEGDLAESWAVSPDGLAFTFKLHKGVKFHDGSPLTSADVKATYERIINPPTGVVSTRRALYEDVSAIETPDDLHSDLQTPRPECFDAGWLRLTLELHLQRRQAQGKPALSRNQYHGNGRVRSGRAREGFLLGRQALRRLLPSGSALPRWIQGLLRQIGGARDWSHWRPVRHRVAWADAGRARPGRRQDEGERGSARGALVRQPDADHQRQEETVRRHARASGSLPRHRPLGRCAGHGQDLAHEVRRRLQPSRLRVRTDRQRAGKASWLRARYRRVARAGQEVCWRKRVSRT